MQAIQGEKSVHLWCFIVQIVAYIQHIVVFSAVAKRLRAMIHQKKGNRCSARVTSAATCGLRHLTLTSASSSIEMITSASCKMITCAELKLLMLKLIKFFGIFADFLVPKFVYPIQQNPTDECLKSLDYCILYYNSALIVCILHNVV